MKKIITIILAAMMCFSVVITGCGDNSSSAEGEVVTETTSTSGLKELEFASTSSTQETLVYEEGVTYSDEIGTYDVDTMKETETVYDKNIFYRNDIVAMAADPFVLYCTDKTDTENYDHYFLYGTTGNAVYNCFKSKDAVSWEPESGAYVWATGGWQYDCTWAPEVIYDAEADPADYGVDDASIYGTGGTGCYFMFSSATAADSYNYFDNYAGKKAYMPIIAVAVRPQGPYKQWEGKELGATIAGVDYGTESGYNSAYMTYDSGVTYRGRDNDEVTVDDPWWNNSAARASMSFQYKYKSKAGSWVNSSGATSTIAKDGYTYIQESAKWLDNDFGKDMFSAIDLSPFVDPVSGDKYLFLTRDTNGLPTILGKDSYGRTYHHGTNIYMIKTLNNDWTQLDYSTLMRVSRSNYNFISDAAAAEYNSQASAFDASAYSQGHKETTTYSMERSTVERRIMGESETSNNINEGTQILYNENTGLYYLTFSMGSYTNNTYTVIQVISYNIWGPYRKLNVGEGGMLLSTDNGAAADNLTGVGHHTMMYLYDEELGREPELVCMYHKHNDLTVSVHERGYCIDRVEWVQNNDGLMVMKVNGPTTYIQPRYYSTGETPYDNLARYDSTTITYASGDNYIVDANHGVDKLNDGIIATVSEVADGSDPVEPYIHEFQTTKSGANVIKVDLGGYHMVTAFMIYNSREYDKSLRTYDGWTDVREVTMSCYKDGVEFTAKFNKINFYQDFCQFKSTATLKLRAGGAVTAVFVEIAVRDITFKLYNTITSQDSVMSNTLAISEIVVLGRPETVNV